MSDWHGVCLCGTAVDLVLVALAWCWRGDACLCGSVVVIDACLCSSVVTRALVAAWLFTVPGWQPGCYIARASLWLVVVPCGWLFVRWFAVFVDVD